MLSCIFLDKPPIERPLAQPAPVAASAPSIGSATAAINVVAASQSGAQAACSRIALAAREVSQTSSQATSQISATSISPVLELDAAASQTATASPSPSPDVEVMSAADAAFLAKIEQEREAFLKREDDYDYDADPQNGRVPDAQTPRDDSKRKNLESLIHVLYRFRFHSELGGFGIPAEDLEDLAPHIERNDEVYSMLIEIIKKTLAKVQEEYPDRLLGIDVQPNNIRVTATAANGETLFFSLSI